MGNKGESKTTQDHVWWTLSDLHFGRGNVLSHVVGLPGSERCLGGESKKISETYFGGLYIPTVDGGNSSKMRGWGDLFFCWAGQASLVLEKWGGTRRFFHSSDCISSTDTDIQGGIYWDYYCSNYGPNPWSSYSSVGSSHLGSLEIELGCRSVPKTSHSWYGSSGVEFYWRSCSCSVHEEGWPHWSPGHRGMGGGGQVLKFGKELNLNNLILEGDTKVVVDVVLSDATNERKIGVLVEDMKLLL